MTKSKKFGNIEKIEDIERPSLRLSCLLSESENINTRPPDQCSKTLVC